ncbi:OST3/OST6 family protein [Plectosphaerella plurivora]|uniref:OST3/OST6 family protein n=1 Tax=Plectosphaerella plurivora TaxID=936078 RepID=A0A9P9A5W8_9PEZI|nr:OST3/OST6 family protein [Plectosphaerella plurivora]
MRLSTIISASLMAIGALAAKQQPEQRFQDFHSKALAASPVKLADSSFKKLTGAPRDYTTMVLLTAMDARYGCQLCREFQPEWDILARSWTNGDKKGNSRVIFGTLDFADGRETFMSLGLQTAPVLLLFQPTTGPHAVASPEPLRYDFTTGPQVAEQVHSWLARHTQGRPHPSIRRPINWMRWFSWTVLSLGTVTALVTASPYLIPLIQSRKLWAGLSLFAILLFTSGHMFNQIRKVPYVAGNGKGGVSYFAGGFQNQFGMETQVVAGVYALLAFCAIGLATKVPRMTDPKRQQIAVVTWGVVLFVLYSFLLSIFRIKNGGYPFSLPPFM